MSDLYYLQDSRSFVGNDMLFWRWNGNGYTTDILQAHVFSKNDAVKHHHDRESDIPWPKSYIDKKVRPAVDCQNVSRKEALRGTGIKIIKPKPPKKWVGHCLQCGGFINDYDRFNGCKNCGGLNLP